VKTADLAVHCLLAQLQDWRNRHDGNFPEELYIQVDGGSENANQYVLCLLELLVVKRIIRVIHLTRLPVGHTHDDIDACFGHIWKFLRKRIISSVESYKLKIEEKFLKSRLRVFVKHIYVIPDYKVVLYFALKLYLLF
jgi:hypothetical protein